jgi:hypothetical protein
MFRQFRYPTHRQALLAALGSAALLITLVVLWLVVSTQTALLNKQLDEYDMRQSQLDNDTNLLWKQLGEMTSAPEMERRMREAGYVTPASVEFLVPAATSTVISPTASVGGGVK